jgi:Barstar (barnase inhibitor)
LTDRETLFQQAAPHLYLSARAEAEFADLFLELLRLRPSAIVRVLRGRKSATRAAFFDEAAAALQFPYYFGENWRAFDECVTALWTPGDATLLLIADAHLLLAEEQPGALQSFTQVIERANQPYDPGAGAALASPPPLKVIFQVGEAERAAFSERLAAAGASAAPLEP